MPMPSLLSRLLTPRRVDGRGTCPDGPRPRPGAMRKHPMPSEMDFKVNIPMPPGAKAPKEAPRLMSAEIALIGKLDDCWSDFVKLPIDKRGEQTVMLAGIHQLQRLIMARLARRIHPEVF
jgi:hypothetical protein